MSNLPLFDSPLSCSRWPLLIHLGEKKMSCFREKTKSVVQRLSKIEPKIGDEKREANL
jgi:hypothetical protein